MQKHPITITCPIREGKGEQRKEEEKELAKSLMTKEHSRHISARYKPCQLHLVHCLTVSKEQLLHPPLKALSLQMVTG